MKTNWFRFSLVLLLMMALNVQLVQADTVVHTYVPIGSDYAADTLESFARSASQRDTNGVVDILVLPITY
ncbi:MAG TPA: hypothetical protein VFQ23_19095, partial [Anaerolineales bacterium]|nr:hypothetical protein [Anaerolineales bacterium]